ncbi:aminotransferase class V-fold PLP-dependent enzyme, partial [Bacillus altitudinis]|uniref:aminotransferase class V-fold PLP-dependent enzyme n=1 Tax=Bacillus altitudinis TaxID=293387 RepID=UPI001F3193C1
MDRWEGLEKVGFDVRYLDVDESGLIDVDELKEGVREDRIVVRMMYGNNERGVMEGMKEIGQVLDDEGGHFDREGVEG